MSVIDISKLSNNSDGDQLRKAFTAFNEAVGEEVVTDLHLLGGPRAGHPPRNSGGQLRKAAQQVTDYFALSLINLDHMQNIMTGNQLREFFTKVNVLLDTPPPTDPLAPNLSLPLNVLNSEVGIVHTYVLSNINTGEPATLWEWAGDGTPPPWLALDPATGGLTGTAEEGSWGGYRVKANNASGESVSSIDAVVINVPVESTENSTGEIEPSEHCSD